MAVSVLLSGTLKDGMVDQFTQMCSDSLDGTRKSVGCQNINLTYHTKEPNKFVLTEVWDSKAKYMEYVVLRREDGTSEKMAEMCDEGPYIDIFNIIDV